MESNHRENFIIGGDLNAILNLEEKYGGSKMVTQVITNFREWSRKNNLLDIPTRNGVYTWNNRR